MPLPRTPLPDERVEWLFELFDPVKRTPAFLEVCFAFEPKNEVFQACKQVRALI